MDLVLYGRVARRFWVVLVGGLLLAIALAVLSTARITPHGLAYRKHVVWQSGSVLLLTMKGFPWGRAVAPKNADPSNLSAGLGSLYSQFAGSDPVRLAMLRSGAPKTWGFSATPDPTGTLPIVDLYGTAYSAADSVKAVSLARRAFIDYLSTHQQGAAIPAAQRVQIQVLTSATPPIVIQPRKKTLPIVIFVAVMTLTVGLVFVLENARPRGAAVAIAIGGDLASPQERVGVLRRR